MGPILYLSFNRDWNHCWPIVKSPIILENSEDSEQHGKLNGGRHESKLFPRKAPTFTNSHMKPRCPRLAVHTDAGARGPRRARG